METLKLKASPRQVTGKKVKALRRQGFTPVHLYGRGIPSVALQAETAVLNRLISQAGKNILVSVEIGGGDNQNISFVRETQRHPVTGQLLHVDFFRVDVTERIRAEVPLVLVGEAPAVRLHNGVLMQALHNLTIECLPMDMPESIEVDVSGLDDFEKAIRIGDIPLGTDVTILADAEDLILRVNPPRVEVAEGAEVAAEVAPPTEEAGEEVES